MNTVKGTLAGLMKVKSWQFQCGTPAHRRLCGAGRAEGRKMNINIDSTIAIKIEIPVSKENKLSVLKIIDDKNTKKEFVNLLTSALEESTTDWLINNFGDLSDGSEIPSIVVSSKINQTGNEAK